jgi:hypothetical protein
MEPYHSTAYLNTVGISQLLEAGDAEPTHGVSAQKKMVEHGGQKDVAVVRTHRMPFPVPESPAQRGLQSRMARGNCAGRKIKPDKGGCPSWVMDDHNVGML